MDGQGSAANRLVAGATYFELTPTLPGERPETLVDSRWILWDAPLQVNRRLSPNPQ